MQNTFQINIQRVDNGFVAIAQNDEPGIKAKKVVALSEDDVKNIGKDFIDHMFDAAPAKQPEAKPSVVPPSTSAPTKA